MLQLNESAGDSKKFRRLIDSVFTGPKTKTHPVIKLYVPETGEEVPPQDCPYYMNVVRE